MPSSRSAPPARGSSASRKSGGARRSSTARAARGYGDVALSERAYSRLEEMITTLQLAPGQALSEPYLSSTLGSHRVSAGT